MTAIWYLLGFLSGLAVSQLLNTVLKKKSKKSAPDKTADEAFSELLSY